MNHLYQIPSGVNRKKQALFLGFNGGHGLIGTTCMEMHNKAVKPFAALTRTSRTPRLFAHGFGMIAQTALRTGRRLPRR